MICVRFNSAFISMEGTAGDQSVRVSCFVVIVTVYTIHVKSTANTYWSLNKVFVF